MERKGELRAGSVRFPGTVRDAACYTRSRFLDLRRREGRSRAAQLAAVVVDEIVPRLKLLHHEFHGDAPRPEHPGFAEVAEFALLTMRLDNTEAAEYLDRMRARSLSLETLLVHLLAPTAHHLIAMLDQDRCDLIDFTMGIARLRQFLFILAQRDEVAFGEVGRRALVVSAPRDRHLLDVDVVAALLTAAGWETCSRSCCKPNTAAALVSHEWFGMLNVTLGNCGDLHAVATIIEAVRHASSNASIRVMATGPMFAGDPGLAIQIGADAAASDLRSAVKLAGKLVARRRAVGYSRL
jgi:methanogenic corrinoid protein MtbC1